MHDGSCEAKKKQVVRNTRSTAVKFVKGAYNYLLWLHDMDLVTVRLSTKVSH